MCLWPNPQSLHKKNRGKTLMSSGICHIMVDSITQRQVVFIPGDTRRPLESSCTVARWTLVISPAGWNICSMSVISNTQGCFLWLEHINLGNMGVESEWFFLIFHLINLYQEVWLFVLSTLGSDSHVVYLTSVEMLLPANAIMMPLTWKPRLPCSQCIKTTGKREDNGSYWGK